jgi:hypothetical protein
MILLSGLIPLMWFKWKAGGSDHAARRFPALPPRSGRRGARADGNQIAAFAAFPYAEPLIAEISP